MCSIINGTEFFLVFLYKFRVTFLSLVCSEGLKIRNIFLNSSPRNKHGSALLKQKHLISGYPALF